ALSDLSGDSINMIIGKNYYAHGRFNPTMVVPNLGVGLIFDQQVSLSAANKAYPRVELGYQTTNGIQVAYGVSLGGRGRRDRSDFRLGVAGKMVSRRGGYRELPLMSLATASLATISQVAGEWGMGYGLDLGT